MNATSNDLAERMKDLARLRAHYDATRAELRAKKEAFDAENAELIHFINEVQAPIVAAAETAVKAIALSLFNETGERKPVTGLEVKVFKAYAVDEVAGLAWAKEKQLCLVPESLDVSAVKKLATVQPLPFVTISEEPKAQIGTDLSKLLVTESVEPAAA